MPYNSEFGLSTLRRVFKKNGGDRIADDAALELGIVLENISYKISRQAIDLAEHAGRTTIKAEDIRLAAKHVITNKKESEYFERR